MKDALADLLWLAGAAVAAWFLPRSFLGFELVAAIISVSLFLLEKKITRRWD